MYIKLLYACDGANEKNRKVYRRQKLMDQWLWFGCPKKVISSFSESVIIYLDTPFIHLIESVDHIFIRRAASGFYKNDQVLFFNISILKVILS